MDRKDCKIMQEHLCNYSIKTTATMMNLLNNKTKLIMKIK